MTISPALRRRSSSARWPSSGRARPWRSQTCATRSTNTVPTRYSSTAWRGARAPRQNREGGRGRSGFPIRCRSPRATSHRSVPVWRPRAARAGRIRDALLRPLLSGVMNKASLPALNATRASIGARPFTIADEMFNVAPLLLYMTAEPFEYPRSDWPAAVRMVGPCCWEPPGEPPPWLDDITRPLVLVTTSSEFQDDGRLVRTALDALADEDVQVVATLPATTLRPADPRQRTGRDVRLARAAAGSSCLRGHARRSRRDTKGARRRRPGVRGPVRPRPARGRTSGRGGKRRDTAPGPEAQRRATAQPGPSRHHQTRRRPPCRRRLPRDRWSPAAADAFETVTAASNTTTPAQSPTRS